MKVTRIAATQQQAAAKKRVAVYCRVSTGRSEQEDSLEMQQTAYLDYIKSRDEWELAGIYSDARSGLSTGKRLGFMQMIADANEEKIDIILCKSISRFSRNIVECQRYTEMLRSKNVVVIFEKENIRTDVPTSSLIFSLMCAIAQDESRSISENIKTSNRHRVEAGVYTPRKNQMMGYDAVEGKLVPNKDAWVIRLIFELYAEGWPAAKICRELNDQGTTRMYAKKPFVSTVLYAVLRNETYVGDKRLQKRPPKNFLTKKPDPSIPYATNYLVDDHEPIVSRELWDRVQKRLSDEEKQRNSGINIQERSSFLYGKIFCGECGSIYRRRTFTEHRRDASVPRSYFKAWNCSQRQNGKKGNGCKNATIREELLLEKISKELSWEWKGPEHFDSERFCKLVERVEITADGVKVQWAKNDV